MVLQLFSFRRAKQPLYNEVSNTLYFETGVRYITQSLIKRIKKTPELLAMLDTVVREHFLAPVDFFTPNGGSLGPTKLKQVRKFWEDEKVQHRAFYGQGMDYFVDGSGFGWHASVNNVMSLKQKEALAKLKALDSQIGEYAQERSHMPRKISYLAASTTSIKHDKYGEVYYVQEAAGERVRWDVDQVVHIKNMEWDGKVRGYTPLTGLARDIVIMYMLKDNIYAALLNGGSMDNIISLVGANGVSRARFERLRTALESFSHLKKSHGNMPIDAEIKVHPVGVALRDMEYRELAMFLISEFALSLGLPVSRVPFLMSGAGGPANKGEFSGNSEDSYQTKMNTRRMGWENDWNQIFRKAGFIFRFRRTNLQDDVRETTASMNRANAVITIQDSLMKSGQQLTLEAHLAFLSGTKLNITEEDVEAMPPQPVVTGAPIAGLGGREQPSNMDSRAHITQQRSAYKGRTASNNEVYA